MSPSSLLRGPSVFDAEALRADRERADAEGVIREVHGYCARRCPLRERCPGMECKQYRREMAAKDVLASLGSSDDAMTAPIGPGGVVMEPQIR